MVKASPYVIRNISMVLENEDFEEAKELCEKFSARYADDVELISICERYKEYQESRDMAILDELKTSLERLKSKRTSGVPDAAMPWIKDSRRPPSVNALNVV